MGTGGVGPTKSWCVRRIALKAAQAALGPLTVPLRVRARPEEAGLEWLAVPGRPQSPAGQEAWPRVVPLRRAVRLDPRSGAKPVNRAAGSTSVARLVA